MQKTLGLDLGTNSIGWAIVESNKNERNQIETSLLDKGVLIFSEGVKNEKGRESSRAAERTGFRNTRKLYFRRKLRKFQTLLILAKNGMCPLTTEEVQNWRKSSFKKYPNNPNFLDWLKTDDENKINPYLFRDNASREMVDKLMLGRAFYHIAQRRGFLSNRLDTSDNSIIEEKTHEIEHIIDETNNAGKLQKELDEYFEDFDNKNDMEKPLFILKRAFYGIIKNSNSDIAELQKKLLTRLRKNENLGEVKQSISDLTERIKAGNFATLGQYFYSLYSKKGVKTK